MFIILLTLHFVLVILLQLRVTRLFEIITLYTYYELHVDEINERKLESLYTVRFEFDARNIITIVIHCNPQ